MAKHTLKIFGHFITLCMKGLKFCYSNSENCNLYVKQWVGKWVQHQRNHANRKLRLCKTNKNFTAMAVRTFVSEFWFHFIGWHFGCNFWFFEKWETRNVFVKTSKGNWFLIMLIMLLNMFVWTKNFREHWSQGSLSFQNIFSCTWHISYKLLVCPLRMCLSWLKYVYTKSTCSTSNCRKRLICLIPLQRDVSKLRLSSNSASNALSIDWW